MDPTKKRPPAGTDERSDSVPRGEGNEHARIVESNSTNLTPQRLNSADDLKKAAALAFRAYDDAVKAGDAELADAAKARFLAASAKLRGGVK